MRMKRWIAGLLGAAVLAGSVSGSAIGSMAQTDADEMREEQPSDGADDARRVQITFALNEGGVVTVRSHAGPGTEQNETVLEVTGARLTVTERRRGEDGAPLWEQMSEEDWSENSTWIMEAVPGEELAVQAAAQASYTVSELERIDAEQNRETMLPEQESDWIFVRAGDTSGIRVRFAPQAGQSGTESAEAEASEQTSDAGTAGEDETEAEASVSPAEETGRQDSSDRSIGDPEQPTDAGAEGDPAARTEDAVLSGETLDEAQAEQALTDPVIEQYLLEHADPQYTAAEFLQVVNLMNAQQTIFSADGLPAGTSLDEAMLSESCLDHWMGSYRYMIPVYWMSEESDYYVAFLNTMQNDSSAEVRDVVFARNNTRGETVSGCIYDRASGIVYIPTALYRDAEDPEGLQIGTVQAQLLQAVRTGQADLDAASGYQVVTSTGEDVISSSGREEMTALETTVQTRAGMNAAKLTVSVNGMPLTPDYYEYNGATGMLTIAMSSASVASVTVSEEDMGVIEAMIRSLGARLVHAVTQDSMPNVYSGLKLKLPAYVEEGMFLQGNVIDTMMSNGSDAYNELSKSAEGAPNVYAYEYTHGHLDYEWDEKNSDGTFKHAAGELIDLIYNGERQEVVKGETLTRKLKYSKLSMYKDAWWQVLNFAHDDSKALNVYTAEGKKTGDAKVSLAALGNIPLTCSHITCPLGNITGGIQDPDEDDLDSGALNLRVKIRVRVFERNDAEGYAVLGVLAAHHRVGSAEADNGQTGVAVFKVAIEPTTVKLSIRKQSGCPSVSDGNTNYSLAGAVYTVYSDADCKTAIGTCTTDASGVTNQITVRIGQTCWYRETKTPKGYLPDARVYSVKADGTEKELRAEVRDEPKEAVPKQLIAKIDDETGEAVPQGDASLAGAVYTVKHYGGTVVSGSPLHTWSFRTDSDGTIPFDSGHLVSGTLVKNSSGKITFPLGVYTIEETTAPDGYLKTEQVWQVSLLEDGTGVKWSDPSVLSAGIPAAETVMRGELQVTKQDLELQKPEALAGGDLAGIRLAVRNASAKAICYQGKMIAPGELVTTLTTDQQGAAATGAKSLPYGSYTVQELSCDKTGVSANSAYLVSDSGTHKLTIREDGAVENETISDQIKRSDLSFRKVSDEADSGMANIPFVLEELDTGEKHVILTDRNGTYSTAKYAHTLETNRLDGLLEGLSEDTVIPSEQLGDYEFGTWFGLGRNGTMAAADDQLSALPYGAYELTELRCEANEGYRLISGYRFTIEEDGEHFDFNNLRNHRDPVAIATTLTDDGTKEHSTSIGEDGLIHLTDTVQCTNLTKGQTYRLKAVLMEQTSEELFRAAAADGVTAPVRGETTFTADAVKMTVPVPLNAFAAPGSSLRVVAYEKLYEVNGQGQQGELLASHEEIGDEGQTVQIPCILTSAADTGTNGHTGIPETTTITDAVQYRNLIPGRTYHVSGVLMDRETEQALTGSDGNPVTAEAEVTPEEADGTVELQFQVDGSLLAGKTVVVFEDLLQEDRLIAVHHEIDDPEQSVFWPAIRTSARDGETGEGTGSTGSSRIYDEVIYSNLIPGSTYQVQGTLMDQKTGKALQDAEGNEITAELTFSPETAAGSVTMTFPVDGGKLAGTAAVVFERLYLVPETDPEAHPDQEGDPAEPVLIAVHEDLQDEAQTVRYPADEEKPPEKTTKKPKPNSKKKEPAEQKTKPVSVVTRKAAALTGDPAMCAVLAAGMIGSGAGLLLLLLYLRRRGTIRLKGRKPRK